MEQSLAFEECLTKAIEKQAEKIKNNTAAVIVPNPGKQMQTV